MLRLPPELISHVISLLDAYDNRTLLSLALTCRLTYTLAAPQLYKEVVITRENLHRVLLGLLPRHAPPSPSPPSFLEHRSDGVPFSKPIKFSQNPHNLHDSAEYNCCAPRSADKHRPTAQAYSLQVGGRRKRKRLPSCDDWDAHEDMLRRMLVRPEDFWDDDVAEGTSAKRHRRTDRLHTLGSLSAAKPELSYPNPLSHARKAELLARVEILHLCSLPDRGCAAYSACPLDKSTFPRLRRVVLESNIPIHQLALFGMDVL